MRWLEIRHHPRGAATVRLLRGETRLVASAAISNVYVPRRRWRVVVQEPTKSHVLLETRAEADAWDTYRRESGDER
jgi:hypothetical protein